VTSTVDHRQTIELLQQLIRNRCVNDGTPESGNERATADVLQTYLEGAGLDVERYTSLGDRTSIVARIEGTDPSAPRLCLMGHTDVVPVNPAGWTQDPFAGDVIDGEVWGRGALDMLGHTASMAVAMKTLAREGWRPRGDLIYFGVADEEAGGQYGAKWVIDNHWDAVACEYVLTELGGFWAGDSRSITIATAEKGMETRRLVVRGTPGHGSMPYGADNAIVKSARIIQRIADHRAEPVTGGLWPNRVRTSGLPDEVQDALLDPERLVETLGTLSVPTARTLHAGVATTMSCNVVHGGQKPNIIPDHVELDVDIRTMPGHDADAVDALLTEIMGELAPDVEIIRRREVTSSSSPAHGPLWDVISRRAKAQFPESDLSASLLVGRTDASFFRARGATAYGAGLFTPDITSSAVSSRFHGNDERIDVESLRLTSQLWYDVATDLLGP
jgi:acetylornithine deacetylase/succinyl-diaminopimelate desuccinylase-like protein